MDVVTNDWVVGLAALIYYEKPKKTEKTKTKPAVSIQFEKLTLDERSRYILIAKNISSYIEKLNMIVLPKPLKVESKQDDHERNEILYETINAQILKWADQVKLFKRIKNLVPWQELARRLQVEIKKKSS